MFRLGEICELVSGLDFDRKFRQYLRAADTLPELQLGLTWPEDQKRLGLAHLADNLVVVVAAV